MRNLFLLLLAGLAGCQTDADIRPANYDELAMATGHWQWDSTAYPHATRTPGTEGYSRQLLFGADHQLVLRRPEQADLRLAYQLSLGPFPRCKAPQPSQPLLTFATNEERLPNNERKSYRLTSAGGQQVLTLTGEAVCVAEGARETYHWVAE